MDLAPPLHVGHLQASVPHLDRRGLKQRLIRELSLIQAGEMEGSGRYNGMQGEPAAAEAA